MWAPVLQVMRIQSVVIRIKKTHSCCVIIFIVRWNDIGTYYLFIEYTHLSEKNTFQYKAKIPNVAIAVIYNGKNLTYFIYAEH